MLEGLPRVALADRKSVLLQMDGATAIWNPQWADFLAAIGAAGGVLTTRKGTFSLSPG